MRRRNGKGSWAVKTEREEEDEQGGRKEEKEWKSLSEPPPWPDEMPKPDKERLLIH